MDKNNMSDTSIDSIIGSINNAVGEGVYKALQPLVEKIKYNEKCYNYVQEMLINSPEYNKLLLENRELRVKLGIDGIKINIHEKAPANEEAVSISSLYNEYDIASDKNQIKLVETDNIESNSKIVARIHDFSDYLIEIADEAIVKYHNELFKDILSIMPDTDSDTSNISIESYDCFPDSPTMNKIAKNLIVGVKTSKPVSKDNCHSVTSGPPLEEDVSNYNKKQVVISNSVAESIEEKTPVVVDEDYHDIPDNADDVDAEEFPIDADGDRINYAENPEEYLYWYKTGVERWREEKYEDEDEDEDDEEIPIKPRKAMIDNVDQEKEAEEVVEEEEEVEEEVVEEEEEEVEEEEVVEKEEEEVVDEEVEEDDSDNESVEELFMVEMEDEDGEVITYYTNDDENGKIYEVCEDESVGDCVGEFKDGEPIISE